MNFDVNIDTDNLDKFVDGLVNIDIVGLQKRLSKRKLANYQEEYGEEKLFMLVNIWEEEYPDIESVNNLPPFIGKPIEIVQIQSDNKKIVLSDQDFYSFIGCEKIDCYSFFSNERFLYTLFRWASGQGGATGIYDMKKDQWVFKETGDDIILDGIVYLPKLNKHLGFVDINTYGWGYKGILIINNNSGKIKDYTLESWKADFSTSKRQEKRIAKKLDGDKYGPGSTGWISLPFLDEEAVFSYDEESKNLCYDMKTYSLKDFEF